MKTAAPISTEMLAGLAGVTVQAARAAARKALGAPLSWRGLTLLTVPVRGKGGRSGETFAVQILDAPSATLPTPVIPVAEAGVTISYRPVAHFDRQHAVLVERVVAFMQDGIDQGMTQKERAAEAARLFYRPNGKPISPSWAIEMYRHPRQTRKVRDDIQRKRVHVSSIFDAAFMAAGRDPSRLRVIAEEVDQHIRDAWAAGVHVHPMHSMHYIHNRLLPGLAEGAARSGRDASKIDKMVPVIVAAGNSPEERATSANEARTTVAFYGATPNYAFQFDDLGYSGLCDQLRDCLRSGNGERSRSLITDEILDQFAVVARWDDIADRMIARYKGIASRLIIYLASHWREVDSTTLERWGEVARAVRKAPDSV